MLLISKPVQFNLLYAGPKQIDIVGFSMTILFVEVLLNVVDFSINLETHFCTKNAARPSKAIIIKTLTIIAIDDFNTFSL